ncbi:MAG: DUF86 domain-containing protein [Propionibacterium sp.]|nr:DUF86 domain-containing protein [Propionibacterium sp.]
MSSGGEERVADILRSVDRCQKYVGALDSDDPDLVDMAEDAIERNLQIIGEAAKLFPSEIIDAHPGIAWPQIRGFRNILVHRYFGVDPDIVRDVVRTHLPPLVAALRGYVDE